MYSNFYYLNEDFKRGAVRANYKDNSLSAEGLFRKGVGTGPPVEYQITEGKKYFDVLGTGFPWLIFASDKVWHLVKEHQLTGISPTPIINEELNSRQYYLCRITGTCGPIRDEFSIKKPRPYKHDPTRTYKAWMGLLFDLPTWDGSDFFSPEGTQHLFVTRRVKDVFEKEKVSNIVLRPIEEMENPRLPYDFT